MSDSATNAKIYPDINTSHCSESTNQAKPPVPLDNETEYILDMVMNVNQMIKTKLGDSMTFMTWLETQHSLGKSVSFELTDYGALIMISSSGAVEFMNLCHDMKDTLDEQSYNNHLTSKTIKVIESLKSDDEFLSWTQSMINKGQLGYYSGSDAKPKSNASLVGSIEDIVENELSFFHMKKTRSGTKFIDSTYDTFHFYPKGCICSQEKTKTIDNPLVSKIGSKMKMHAMMDVNEWMDTNFVMSYQSLCFHQKHPKDIIPFTHLGYAKEDTILFELDSNEKLKESDIIY